MQYARCATSARSLPTTAISRTLTCSCVRSATPATHNLRENNMQHNDKINKTTIKVLDQAILDSFCSFIKQNQSRLDECCNRVLENPFRVIYTPMDTKTFDPLE